MLFFIFLFYETIYNPFSNSKIHSYNLPPRFSQKRFVNEICLEVFPLSSVQWTVCLLGCSSWMFSTMGLDDDSEQNPMVGTPQASSDNYYNHTIMVLQVDVFFHNTSRKLFTSGMMNDSQAQSYRYYDAGSWQTHNFPLEHKHNLFPMFCVLACADFLLKRTTVSKFCWTSSGRSDLENPPVNEEGN